MGYRSPKRGRARYKLQIWRCDYEIDKIESWKTHPVISVTMLEPVLLGDDPFDRQAPEPQAIEDEYHWLGKVFTSCYYYFFLFIVLIRWLSVLRWSVRKSKGIRIYWLPLVLTNFFQFTRPPFSAFWAVSSYRTLHGCLPYRQKSINVY